MHLSMCQPGVMIVSLA